MIKVTSSLFYDDDWTGEAGGGTPYLTGSVGDKKLHILKFYIYWAVETARITFDSSTKTMTITNRNDPRTFTAQGFKVGDTISVEDSAANDGTFTITEISTDGKMITVAESVTSGKNDGVSIYGDTPVVSLEYLFNLIKNGNPESYISLTDPQYKQRFIVNSIDASSVTPVDFYPGSNSLAWITNDIDPSGTVDELTIEGEGITDHKQQFIIRHKFIITPLNLVGQYNNFSNNTPPDYFQSDSALTYICSLGAKYENNVPDSVHVGGITGVKGFTAWFNRSQNGTPSDYSIEAVSYYNNDTSEELTAIDVTKDTRVEVTFKSKAGKFVNVGGGVPVGTSVLLSLFILPGSELQYQNTETNLRENYFLDRAKTSTGVAAINGDFYSTDYQSITGYTVTYVSANELTIEFIVKPGTKLSEYWKAREDSDRNYAFVLTTQDKTISTTKGTDRAAIIGDFQSALYDKTDTTITGFTKTGIEFIAYPLNYEDPRGSAEGVEGEKYIARLPFWFSNQADADGNTPTLKSLTCSIRAVKNGFSDFTLEQKIISTEGLQKLFSDSMGFVQQIDIEEERDFISYADDPFNLVFLTRDSDYDQTNKPAYLAHYGFVLRYENWISALNQFQIITGGVRSEIAKYIENINHNWSEYNNVNGWSLVFRFDWIVTDVNGNDQPFYTTAPIVVNATNEVTWPDGTGEKTLSIQYFEWDEVEEIEGEELNMVDAENKTLIRATYTGDYSLPAGAQRWCGMLFANLPTGSIYDRLVASSENDSEEGSPWSVTPENVSADYTYVSANCRVNVYLSGVTVEKIEVEALIDGTYYDNQVDELQIFTNLLPVFIGSSS